MKYGLVLSLLVAGCAQDGGDEGGHEASACDALPPGDAGPRDAAPPPDAWVRDGQVLDAQPADAQVDAQVASACAFNRECPDDQRCACTEEAGCACEVGPRGTGEAGEPCDNGNDCASSVCLEGPGNTFLCTRECASDNECPDSLPQCVPVAFVGQVCIRAS